METMEIAYFAFGGVVDGIHEVQRTIAQSNHPSTPAFGQTIQTQILLVGQCIVGVFVQLILFLHGK